MIKYSIKVSFIIHSIGTSSKLLLMCACHGLDIAARDLFLCAGTHMQRAQAQVAENPVAGAEFICSFSRCLWLTFCVPGPVLGTGDKQ